MPELYGKSILVERHFTRGGGSGFNSSRRKGVSFPRKVDLDEICDHMILQIDNPWPSFLKIRLGNSIASSAMKRSTIFS